MSSGIFIFILAIVAIGFLFAAALVVGALYEHGRRWMDILRGHRADAVCPYTGQRTEVRLGRTAEYPRIGVLTCERFGLGSLRCQANCLPRWSDLPRKDLAA